MMDAAAAHRAVAFRPIKADAILTANDLEIFTNHIGAEARRIEIALHPTAETTSGQGRIDIPAIPFDAAIAESTAAPALKILPEIIITGCVTFGRSWQLATTPSPEPVCPILHLPAKVSKPMKSHRSPSPKRDRSSPSDTGTASATTH
jgi:hypothetical protein